MKSIFHNFVLCVAMCGVLHTRPSQEIEPLSSLAHTYFDIETKIIGEYKIFVAKPKGKHTKPYPALVVLDGNAHFPITINQYIMHQYTPSIEPLLIIGIGYDGDLAYDTLRRTRDYTPMAREGKGGGAARFYEVLHTRIMPWLKETYFITESRIESRNLDAANTNNIGFFGHSFGGLFGLYVFLHHQEMFSHYMIASPSLWWGDIKIPDSLSCRSKLSFSYGIQEPKKSDMSLLNFAKLLSARCAKCLSAQALSGGHGDSIRPSIVLILNVLLNKGEFYDCEQEI